VLVLTARAVHILGERLQGFGELLPLSCADAELYVYNPLHIVDALDEERSEIVRFSSGRVMRITRHVFRTEVLAGVPIFKIPQLTRGSIFVAAELVQAVKAAGLQGTNFERVWADYA
jgi:hypothetical protein